jgi:hypothetical protein
MSRIAWEALDAWVRERITRQHDEDQTAAAFRQMLRTAPDSEVDEIIAAVRRGPISGLDPQNRPPHPTRPRA